MRDDVLTIDGKVGGGFRKVAIGTLAVASFGSVQRAHAQYVGHVSSIVVNANTGRVVSAQDPDLRRYPASLTKLMTLYMTFRALRDGRLTLHDRIVVSPRAARMPPSKLGLRPGGRLTVRQAIYALVTKSANDAACALGEHLGGGDEDRFARQMTVRAHEIGMYSTTFENASGLPDPRQVSTARDLSLLAQRIVVDYPEYYRYFSAGAFMFHRRRIQNHNPMLSMYNGADGMKTGYTEMAGHNLITSAQRRGVRLVGVVLGAESNQERTARMVSLLDAGFMAYGQKVQPLLIPVSARSRMRTHGRAHVVLVSYRRKRAVAARRRPTIYRHVVARRRAASVRRLPMRHPSVRHP